MDKKRNADICQEPNAVPVLDIFENYRHNWTMNLQSYEQIHNSKTDEKLQVYNDPKKDLIKVE